MQYDFGKSVQGKEFIRTGRFNKPPSIVLRVVGMLQGQQERKGHKLSEQLSKMVSDNRRMATKFEYPGLAKDQLFKSNFAHLNDKKQCKDCCGSLGVNLCQKEETRYSDPVLK